MIKRIAVAAVCALTLNASASVITFNGLAGTTQSGGTVVTPTSTLYSIYKPYTYVSGTSQAFTVGGFTFSSGGNSYLMSSEYFTSTGNASNYAGNGTDFLMGNNIKMASATNQLFSLDAVDLGWFSYNGSSIVTLTGTRLDGTTVSKALTVAANNATTANDFTSFAFTGFTNLKSLQFASTTSSIAIDNITVNAVPEPATLALMGLGLAGLVARRRRKQA